MERIPNNYIANSRILELFEAFMCALAVMCPEDQIQFIIDKMTTVEIDQYAIYSWDMFIDPRFKPCKRIASNLNLNAELTGSMYKKITKAYEHYNKSKLVQYFHALTRYHLKNKLKIALLSDFNYIADSFYNHKMLKNHFCKWSKLERGEKVEDESNQFNDTGEARDDISMLPKNSPTGYLLLLVWANRTCENPLLPPI
ncbi:hypothetical protein A3Q56_05189 [Intoshia linei]|uniref:Uncharacterized protein n=1 Tax=Intoshia linei TaxID=1819745 RepID=A0A177AYF1_9BILA|nr:hypothetical protein A3Q56_05189 [Intoshia linei]